jgi:anti-sigma regulatory factor (Ser/Thr protein kinase)
VTARQRQTLELTLPADPELARLARLVSAHFFRQNGLTAAAARRGARAVEKRCRPILRAAARRSRHGRAALVLVLRPQSSTVEAVGRGGGGRRAFLLRLARGGTRS